MVDRKLLEIYKCIICVTNMEGDMWLIVYFPDPK